MLIKTVLELDLKGYSDVAFQLEEHISAEMVVKFNEQIQELIDAGLVAAGVTRNEAVHATTGDGAILLFDSPSTAHVVAVAVHQACCLRNHGKTVSAAKRWFRIGMATGELAFTTYKGTELCGGTAQRINRVRHHIHITRTKTPASTSLMEQKCHETPANAGDSLFFRRNQSGRPCL